MRKYLRDLAVSAGLLVIVAADWRSVERPHAEFGRDATDRYCGGICAGGLLWPTRALPDRAIVDDYQWSRDPATDPRLNRITGRTYYLPLSATPSVFSPAFGPGWGFAA